jgi:hypothetical protein
MSRLRVARNGKQCRTRSVPPGWVFVPQIARSAGEGRIAALLIHGPPAASTSVSGVEAARKVQDGRQAQGAGHRGEMLRIHRVAVHEHYDRARIPG